MKKKHNIIAIVIIAIVLIVGSLIAYHFLKDENKLTVQEQKWVNDNSKNVLSVNVINNANIFGRDGEGVYYKFLADFGKEYNLNLNPITFNDSPKSTGITFTQKKSLDSKDKVFYEDDYVLIGLKDETIAKQTDLKNKSIGILASDLSYISDYIDSSNMNFKQYDTKENMLKGFGSEIQYIMVPMFSYLDTILTNNYNIIYHFSDIKTYYVMSTDDTLLSNVMLKYFNKWSKDNLYENLNKYEFTLFKDKLKLSDSDVADIRKVDYNYGFVNASPYEIIKGGNYGGIIAVTLKDFSDFSGVGFNFNRYKNFHDFSTAINKNKVDVYFNHYNIANDYIETSSVFPISYSVIAKRSNSLNVLSLKSLKDKEVYVEENSKISNYINSIGNIKIKTYKDEEELSKLNKQDVIIVLDSHTYDYYANDLLNNYTERYEGNVSDAYTFKVNKDKTLAILLNKYVSTLDKNTLVNQGLENHYETMRSGVILGTIAKYIIYLLVIAAFVLLLLVKKTRKIKIAKKIKRDDKLKFIDQLTSLKNRNYLNECLESWNNNTIYPQTVIVVDLNNIQEINDINGYSEGDHQIQACANALIKTQLDNSEIMRTDGNEFVMYLVGYNQKQVANYIHKLNKEMEKLPYDNGAEFGYSMITDDLKTVEDALNEAVEDMKKQKQEAKNEGKN